MATKITLEEYKRKFGKLPDFSTAKTTNTQETGPSLGERLGNTGTEMRERVSGNISGTGDYADKSLLNRGVGATATVFSGVAKGALDYAPKPVREAASYVGEKVGQGFNATTDFVSDSKGLQGFMKDVPKNNLGEEILGTVSGAGEIAGTISGAKGTAGALNRTVNLTKKVGTAVSDTANTLKNKIPLSKPLNPIDTAVQDATPNYEASTPTQKGKLLDRTQEGGILKGRTVKPNALEIEAGTELSKVPGYNPNSTKLAKFQVAKTENIKRGQALEASLKTEKVVVPKREIVSTVKKVINDVPNYSLLLAKSDPVIINYMRVLENAVNKVDGTLSGVLKLRKLLDDTYENARGKQAYGSDKISALDDVHKPARDALTQYLISHAKNTDVKASLRSQWNLYRAMDELQSAAEKESGSIIGRFRQNNPVLNRAAELGIQATGLGAGLGLTK